MKRAEKKQNSRKSRQLQIVCVWFRLALKKHICLMFLEVLALKVAIVERFSLYSYIQGIEEIMQHVYADQSVHHRSVIVSVSSLRHVCQLHLFPTMMRHVLRRLEMETDLAG